MPIYEYRCRDCGQVTEVLVRSITSQTGLNCPNCRSKNLDKIVSSPAAVITVNPSPKGKTCCGKDERCEAPPCSSGGTCRRG